jgi:hypothetical protein
MRFLNQRPRPPKTPADLRVTDLEAFFRHRGRNNDYLALIDQRDVRGVLLLDPIRDFLTPDIVDLLQTRLPVRQKPEGVAGYSEGEFTRLVSAARADVAAIRSRLKAGDELLTRLEEEPASLSDEDRDLAATLAGIATTGFVPPLPGWDATRLPQRNALASHLFLIPRDLTPLLVLLAAVSGRNGETIKELPAAHRILDGVAVELQVLKRRRGPRRWFETVTWEIRRPGRELHTPGGLYLLLLKLTERSARSAHPRTRSASGLTATTTGWPARSPNTPARSKRPCTAATSRCRSGPLDGSTPSWPISRHRQPTAAPPRTRTPLLTRPLTLLSHSR